MRQHAGDHGGDRRAAGHVENRLVVNQVGDRLGPGGVRIGHRQAAIGRAGADRDDSRGSFGDFFEHRQIGDAGDCRVVAVLAGGDRAVDHQQVFAPVLFHRHLARMLGGIAGGSLQGVVIVERDVIEDQAFHGRCMAAGERFGAAGAFLEGQPDHRRSPGVFQGRGDRRNHRRRQGHHRRGGGAEFEETAAGDAALAQSLAQCHFTVGLGGQIVGHGSSCRDRGVSLVCCVRLRPGAHSARPVLRERLLPGSPARWACG